MWQRQFKQEIAALVKVFGLEFTSIQSVQITKWKELLKWYELEAHEKLHEYRKYCIPIF